MPRVDRVLVTCEHGGCRVPRPYRSLFAGHRRRLNSHRGYDRGALTLARHLAAQWKAPLVSSDITRLLVDLNRSEGNRAVFSDLVRRLDSAERARLLDRYHRPYRRAVMERILRMSGAGRRVVHVSVHTFTPVLAGNRRPFDVGLLYDPRRASERAFCLQWRAALRRIDPDLTVRMNQPYLGASDGLTTYLRGRLAEGRYLGIELEVNQKWFHPDATRRARRRQAVLTALAEAAAVPLTK